MNFDLASLLGYIFGGGFGLFELIKFLNTRKEEKKGAQLNNEHTAVEAANDTTQIALSALQSIEQERDNLAARNQELRDELDDLRSERAIGTMYLCRNIDCPLRNPEYLLGREWFDNYDIHGATSIADRRSLKEIASEKGYVLNLHKSKD